MSTKLEGEARTEALAILAATGWAHDPARDVISKRFVFKDFRSAFGWMTHAAMWAEKLDHHPEWSNVYKTVDVVLTTHDVSGLSDLDLALAQRLDAI